MATACGQPKPPCGGDWGGLSEAEPAWHVRADANPDGDGSERDPFLVLSDALEAARGADVRRIIVGAGTFRANLDVDGGPRRHDGLELLGCGTELTTLEPTDAQEPTIRITEASDVLVSGMTLRGGATPLFIWGGSEAEVTELHIDEPRITGFVVDGPLSTVDLGLVTVEDTQMDDGGQFGYGGVITGAQVTWSGGGVSNAHSAAVIIDGDTATLDASDLDIVSTQPNGAGAFGRGLQVQGFAGATVSDSRFADHRDAALFGLLPGPLVVQDSTFESTLASNEGGDAIVVTGIDDRGARLDPANFQATLERNTIDGADRAGVLFERVTAVANDNVIMGTGTGQERISQEGAVLSGNDVFVVPSESLEVLREALTSVEPPK